MLFFHTKHLDGSGAHLTCYALYKAGDGEYALFADVLFAEREERHEHGDPEQQQAQGEHEQRRLPHVGEVGRRHVQTRDVGAAVVL